ncbi:MAG: enoyl-CoA hydratase/isomerase family protein [Deltaproteobacteria bacterium]|nr:enoyl-CoA hydratase/isomerase family protein [Deltaproteobacteria bacterium]MBI4795459.1 enoyl-CoA hydratase/isomerase family protein [Deltaproteobacteria bacterium]
MSYNTLIFTIDGPAATLSFNRPEKLNAVSPEMLTEFSQALDEVRGNKAIRVLLLTGQGRAFIAGADIKHFLDLDPLSARQLAVQGQDLFSKLEGLPIPVIACVHGFALGGGLEVALACDFIYAAEKAKFGAPEINLGFNPCWGGPQRLARLAGKSLAKELCLTGRFFDAEEAKALGLVARVFPEDTFLEECRNAARDLAAKGRLAMESVKRVIDWGADVDLKTGCALEAETFALCFTSPDVKEGVTAFLEKRKPRFQP